MFTNGVVFAEVLFGVVWTWRDRVWLRKLIFPNLGRWTREIFLVLGIVPVFGLASRRNLKRESIQSESDVSGFGRVISDLPRPPKQLDRTALLAFKSSISKGLKGVGKDSAHGSPRQGLTGALLDAVSEVGGLPRTQIKEVLESLLNSLSIARCGVPCSQVFGLKQGEITTYPAVGTGNLRGSDLSTRGPGWTHH